MLQGQFYDLRVGGINHDGGLHLAGQKVKERLHVRRFVPVRVLKAHVQDVRAVPYLPAAYLGRFLESSLRNQAAEPAASQHVGALPDNDGPHILVHQQGLNPGDPGLVGLDRLACRFALGYFSKSVDVFRHRAAAPAYQVHPTGIDEPAQRGSHHLRRLVVVPVLVGQTRVGQAGHREPGQPGQRPHMIGHKLRAGGAVETDPQQVPVRQRSVECLGILPRQQGPHRLHCALNGHWNLPPQLGKGPVDAIKPGLDVDRVLRSLQQQDVDASLHQPCGLFLVRDGQFVKCHAAGHRYGLGGRPHRPRNKTGLLRGRSGIAQFAGDTGRRQVDPSRLVRQLILGQHNGGRSESVGLQDVRPGIQEPLVNTGNRLGPGENQVLVAALVLGPPEVPRAKVKLLYRSAHRPVQDDDTLPDY